MYLTNAYIRHFASKFKILITCTILYIMYWIEKTLCCTLYNDTYTYVHPLLQFCVFFLRGLLKLWGDDKKLKRTWVWSQVLKIFSFPPNIPEFPLWVVLPEQVFWKERKKVLWDWHMKIHVAWYDLVLNEFWYNFNIFFLLVLISLQLNIIFSLIDWNPYHLNNLNS